jgi:hypothetical protein
VAEQLPLLAAYAAASIQERGAAGPRAGHPVRRLRSAAAVVDGDKPRCARLEGFSLHANVALPGHAREQLEHLCRYLLKRVFALDVLLCPRCGGRRRIVGVYPEGLRLRDLLQRLGLGDHSSRPPPEPSG